MAKLFFFRNIVFKELTWGKSHNENLRDGTPPSYFLSACLTNNPYMATSQLFIPIYVSKLSPRKCLTVLELLVKKYCFARGNESVRMHARITCRF